MRNIHSTIDSTNFSTFLSNCYIYCIRFNIVSILATSSWYLTANKRVPTTSFLTIYDRILYWSGKVFLFDFLACKRGYLHRGICNVSDRNNAHYMFSTCLWNVSYRQVGRLIQRQTWKSKLLIENKHVIMTRNDIYSYRIEQAMTIDTLQKNFFGNENLIYKGLIYAVDMHRKAMRLIFLCILIFYNIYIYIYCYIYIAKYA